MSSGYSDEPSDGPPATPARSRVSAPGLLVLLLGLLATGLNVATLVTVAVNPTAMYDLFVQLANSQPPGPERQQMLDDIKAKEAELRLDNPTNIATTALGLLLSLLMVVGGLKMRSLSGYPLAVAGAAAALVPCNGCCCLAMPFGIWALVVLMNADVKAAFAAAARPNDGYGPSDDGGREWR